MTSDKPGLCLWFRVYLSLVCFSVLRGACDTTTKSLSKPNKKILEPEPEPEQVQGSGLQKDVFGPSHFFQKEENQF